jgi:hypothetical protein
LSPFPSLFSPSPFVSVVPVDHVPITYSDPLSQKSASKGVPEEAPGEARLQSGRQAEVKAVGPDGCCFGGCFEYIGEGPEQGSEITRPPPFWSRPTADVAF